MIFVDKPNLPQKVKTLIIGEKYRGTLNDPLEKKGINVLYAPDNPHVDPRLCGHADLSVVHLGGNKIALAKYLNGSAFAENLEKMGFEVCFSDNKQSSEYPYDAGLNMCMCGNKLIFNPKSADLRIVEYLTNTKGLTKIQVKQGYSKCSACVVKENVIISSDRGIHEKAVANGLESLNISPGYIALDGFEYGFIGGASFKIDKDTLAFTGALDAHPDKNKILEFLSLHNINAVYITENEAFDIGSAIQLVEKDSCDK